MKKTIRILLKYNGVFLIVIALITVFLSLKLGEVEMKEDEETFISPSSPVLKEYREFQQTFEANEGVIVCFESEDLFSETEINYLKGLHSRLEKLPGVSEVNSLINADHILGVEGGIEINPLLDTLSIDSLMLQQAAEKAKGNPLFEGVFVSEDQQVTALLIDLPGMFNGGSDSLQAAFFNALQQLVDSEENRFGRILYTGGDIVTDASIEKLMDRDLSILFPLSLLFSALILLIFYRRLLTTIVPLIPVLIAILWVMGLKGWTGVPMTPISITLFPLIMVIGLANSIHIISHYRQLRIKLTSNRDTMEQTLMAVLKPCFLAALTTAIGFGSLAVSDVTGIRQMGIFAAFGIMSAFFISITVIPFALKNSKLFTRKPTLTKRNQTLEPLLLKIDSWNQRYPLRVALLFSGVMILMLAFIPRIKVEGSMASFAKENTRLRKDIRFIDEHLSGINSYELVFSGDEDVFKDPAILVEMDSLHSRLAVDENVLKVFSVSDLVKKINRALHSDDPHYDCIPETGTEVAQYLFLYEISGGEQLSDFVDETYATARMTIRTRQMSHAEQKVFLELLEESLGNTFSSIETKITGFGMLMEHINNNLIGTQVKSTLMALGIILLLMFLLFGLRGGFLSLLPNLFPIAFFMGIMGLSGIELNMATSIIAAVTIGIVVDDTIHFFFGYKKEMARYNDPSLSVKAAITKVGAALCVTSVILTIGFAILLFSSSKFIADFGILSASAIAAALLGDLFIAPVALIKSKLFIKK